MIVRDRSFPHPVLAPFRDDVSPNDFSLAVSVTADADSYYLDVSLDYSNQALDSLISRGDALRVVHVECKRNFYRRLFPLRSKDERVVIDAADIAGRIEVCGFVLATTQLHEYQIDGSHKDYEGVVFTIEAGDVLALSPTLEFDAYLEYDPLANLSSVLVIRRSESDSDGPMTLDTSGDQIIVTLSQMDYDNYVELKGDPGLGPLLANQVVVPALIEAVHEIKQVDEEEYELDMSKRWFRSVAKKLEDLALDVRKSDRSPLEAVQALLRLPLRRSLEGLLQLTELEGDA